MKERTRTRRRGRKDEDAGTGHGRIAATSTTPIRHSRTRVIKRPRDLFPSEPRRERRIHRTTISVYNYDTGESAACPKGNRPRPPPPPPWLRLIIAVPFGRGPIVGADRGTDIFRESDATRSIPFPAPEIGIARRNRNGTSPPTNGFFTRGAESKGASSPRLHRRPSGVSTWV